jgi:regulator of protease activity HflC (stomatin/prohibitin superfamily)
MKRMFRGLTEWWARHELKLTIIVLFVLFVFVYFWSSMVISVDAGERGVFFSRFTGTKVNRVYLEGLHLIPPWDKMAIYNVRLQSVDRSYTVLSKDGLEITVDVTIRFRPAEKLVGRLHAQVGPTYVDTVIVPEVGSGVRAVVSKYEPDDLYKESFLSIQEQIVDYARAEIQERYVHLDDVLVRAIILPRMVAEAIQRKLAWEQSALEMQYRLDRERLEADRKRIEATGIRDFQTTIATGLSTQYLRYKGIEATLELAQSPNAKVIVVGSGPSGLPLIFNADTLAPTVPGVGVTAPAVPNAPPPARPPG